MPLRELSVDDVLELFREAAHRHLALSVDITTRVITLSPEGGAGEDRGLVARDVFTKAVNQMTKGGTASFGLAPEARAHAIPDLDYDGWMPDTLKSS